MSIYNNKLFKLKAMVYLKTKITGLLVGAVIDRIKSYYF